MIKNKIYSHQVSILNDFKLFHSTKDIALIPEIDLVSIFEDCFKIEVGLF